MVIYDSHNRTSGIGCLAVDAQENQLNQTEHKPILSPHYVETTPQRLLSDSLGAHARIDAHRTEQQWARGPLSSLSI